MKKNKNFLNLISFLLGIGINIMLSPSRQWQNTFISLTIYFFANIAIFFFIKVYLKKINPNAVLLGILFLELLGFYINPKAWLLLTSEILVIVSTFFYIDKIYFLKNLQRVFYPVIIFFVICLTAFFIEPKLFLNKNTSNIDTDSVFFSKTLYSTISLKDKKMNTIDVSTFSNKVVLFDFWFKGCKPCKIKEAALNELANLFEGDSLFQIVVINPGTINSFKEYSEYNFPSPKIHSLYDSNGVLSEFYKIRGFPTEFLINKQGKIEHRIEGFTENSNILYVESLKNKILKCLKK